MGPSRNVAEGRVPKIRHVALVNVVETFGAKAPTIAVIAFAGLMKQSPHSRLKVAHRDGRAARVLLAPPHLRAAGDGGAHGDCIHQDRNLVETVGLIDVGRKLRVRQDTVVSVRLALVPRRLVIVVPIEVHAPALLIVISVAID